MACRKQLPSDGTCRIAECQLHRCGGSRNTGQEEITIIADRSARRLHGGGNDFLCVCIVDSHNRLTWNGIHETAFNGEGTNSGRDIAAVSGIGDDGLVNADLCKGIIYVCILSLGRRNNRYLAGYGGCPAQTVNLSDVRTAHQPQQQRIPLRACRRKFFFQNIEASACPAAHNAAWNFIVHRITLFSENFIQTNCRQQCADCHADNGCQE